MPYLPPPQSDTEKNEFLAPAVFQSPRLHECGPADAHGNAQPFCMGKCIFRKKTPVLQFGHTLEQNSSICPIISYLWMVDLVMRFFSCGASLWRSSTRIRPKKGPAPWILFLTPAPRPLQVTFFWLVKLNICGCTLLQGQMHFQQKNICFVIWARVDTKFLNSSHHVLSVDDWPGDATFFLWGQPLKIIRKYSVKKGPAPWFLFLTRAPRPLEVTFFGWWSWTYVVVPLLQGQMYFQKKNACFAIWARWHKILEFVPSCPICGWLAWRCDFLPVGQPLKIIRKYSVKKRSSPLDFIFDTCASASWSHFFGWWSWTCVSVPFCKDNCIFSKKNMCFAIWARVDTKFLNSSHHVLSVDDWPGDATFSCGANLWRSSASIQSKKVQPLGFYFWPLRLGLLKSLFWLVKVNICVCTLLQGQMYFQKKKCLFCNLGPVDTKFLNSSHHVLSVDDWPGDATFFLWANLWRSSASIQSKQVQPLGFYFWLLRLGLLQSLFWLVKVNICVCTLLQSHVKNHTPSINHCTFFPGVWHLDMF